MVILSRQKSIKEERFRNEKISRIAFGPDPGI
jgi:hypothetical protein